MDKKPIDQEFLFLKEKLEKIGRLLVAHSESDIAEACFLLGCLHSICYYNSTIYKDKVE